MEKSRPPRPSRTTSEQLSVLGSRFDAYIEQNGLPFPNPGGNASFWQLNLIAYLVARYLISVEEWYRVLMLLDYLDDSWWHRYFRTCETRLILFS